MLILLNLFRANAQTFEFLKHQWINAPSDTAKINAGLKLCTKYYSQTNDSVFQESKLLLKIYNQSLKSDYGNGEVESSFLLGNNYITRGNHRKGVEYFYISLKASEKYNNLNGKAAAMMGIGIVYFIQNNFPKAIEYFKGALLINKKIKDFKRLATQYYLIGYALNELKKYKESNLYIDSSLRIRIEQNDTKSINECKLVKGHIYKGLNQYDSAMGYYKKLLPYFLEQKEFIPVSFIHTSFAQIYFYKKEFVEALKEANTAYNFSLKSISSAPKIEATLILYKVNEAIGNYKKALGYLNQHNVLRDSVENSDYASQLSLAQATYHFEKEQLSLKAKQAKKELLYKMEIQDKNNKQYVLISVLILSSFVVLIIIMALRRVSHQRRISENLLKNILPDETIRELKAFGKSLPKNHPGVSIMFCDIKNFSHIAESLSPEQIVEMLDTYFKNFDMITSKYGIEKIKTIGDAYMCVGGLHAEMKTSAINTLMAANEILEFNKSIEREMLQKYNQAFYFRIGVHTGNVVSGVVGLHKYSYDIWGDAVNIAARMEQNSEPGKINISGGTYEIIKNDYKNLPYRGRIPVKNKGEIDMYFFELN